MRQTLRRNPQAVIIVEVFPDGLQAAGSSATELMESIREFGLHGWELHEDRILPVTEPWVYDLIRNGQYVDVVLSQDKEALERLLSDFYGRRLTGLPAGSR